MFGMNIVNTLEIIHLQFCKQVLIVRRRTQNSFIYGEFGRDPLKIKLLSRALKYWFKIMRSPDENIIKREYNAILNELEACREKTS